MQKRTKQQKQFAKDVRQARTAHRVALPAPSFGTQLQRVWPTILASQVADAKRTVKRLMDERAWHAGIGDREQTEATDRAIRKVWDRFTVACATRDDATRQAQAFERCGLIVTTKHDIVTVVGMR